MEREDKASTEGGGARRREAWPSVASFELLVQNSLQISASRFSVISESTDSLYRIRQPGFSFLSFVIKINVTFKDPQIKTGVSFRHHLEVLFRLLFHRLFVKVSQPVFQAFRLLTFGHQVGCCPTSGCWGIPTDPHFIRLFSCHLEQDMCANS